jgi:SAM-dependent methyltransferase
MRLEALRSHVKALRARITGRGETPSYSYQPAQADLSYDDAIAVLAKKGYDVRRGHIEDLDDDDLDRVGIELSGYDVRVQDAFVNSHDYNEYVARAGYLDTYRDYYCNNRPEKTLEHFLAFRELHLGGGDVFVDIASEHSPIPQIYSRLSGAKCYAQDIQYRPGMRGKKIGGDACAMPVPDRFATSATLTCSLEHFEADADIRLFRELSRVLKPGGKLVVAPLYMAMVDAAQTDPLYSAANDVQFDEGCVVYCKEGWGNRHGRFYSPKSLVHRLIERYDDQFEFNIFRLRNYADLSQGVYLRLFMTCVKR